MFRYVLGWRTLREPETLDNPPLSETARDQAGQPQPNFKTGALTARPPSVIAWRNWLGAPQNLEDVIGDIGGWCRYLSGSRRSTRKGQCFPTSCGLLTGLKPILET